mmetsp:Transcript_20882/g.19923  ORF Transcript_20882/g.19923 Transcript_20882/m.19923 type:complete len:135 (-) Transcript_20882:1103-1507(-)
MKHIHLECLQGWLNSKRITKSTPNIKSYIWKSLDCELCKSPFPQHIHQKNKNITLRVMEYELPKRNLDELGSYLVLESINLQSTSNKSIHIINFSNINQIKIGRANDSDVRINDISVSRFHATILKTAKGHFYI